MQKLQAFAMHEVNSTTQITPFKFRKDGRRWQLQKKLLLCMQVTQSFLKIQSLVSRQRAMFMHLHFFV